MIFRSLLLTVLLYGTCMAQELPEGYWTLEQTTEVLSRTRAVA
jgi:hypothetical protein